MHWNYEQSIEDGNRQVIGTDSIGAAVPRHNRRKYIILP